MESFVKVYNIYININKWRLAVNSFLIATKLKALDTKQSVSVSETSFTQQ